MEREVSRFSRRWVVGALLSGVAAPAWGEAPARSPRPVPRPAPPATAEITLRATRGRTPEALIEAARLGGRVGYALIDVATGEVLEARDGDVPLPPASVAKALTTLYALDRLGPGYRFVTRLVATGPVVAGRVEGDLVLTGTGDPTLTSDGLGELAAKLKAAGVKSVAGRFLVHGAALPKVAAIDETQPEHVGYNPAVSGLNLNYNRVHFEWKRAEAGWRVSMDARGERFVPPVRMARMKVVQRDLPTYTYSGGEAVEDWTVAASALGANGSRWLPVRHPELYTAEVFQTLARAQGITLPDAQVTGSAPTGTELAQLGSPQLGPILRDMLRFSTNLTAEVVGLSASRAGNLRGSALRMSEWLSQRYGGAPSLVDHSGLGVASRITPLDMARIVAKAGPSGALKGLMRSFGLSDAAKALKVEVAAKTGTLNFVSGLAGYVTLKGGRQFAFAIFAADLARRDAIALGDRERPPGGREWTGRARTLQAALIENWAARLG